MNKKILLSHAHTDAPIAKALTSMIRRVTLSQLDVWHSSDDRVGIGPGDRWQDTLRSHLANSAAVVPLLTPASLHRPWLHFESGFGAASAELEVIPVCVGVDSIGDIPFPLAMYQTYRLADLRSTTDFLRRLLAKFDIEFDEEMAGVAIRPGVSEILEIVSRRPAEEQSQDPIASIKAHFDLRFAQMSREPVDPAPYSIELNVLFPSLRLQEYVVIRPESTAADVLDEIWFLLQDQVEPYTYLEKWIVKNKTRDLFLVVRDVQSLIPACALFPEGSSYAALPLLKPYTTALLGAKRPQ